MQLFFRKSGSGNPLIIMHGLFGSSDNWLTISKQFAEHFEVFVLDLRNHGQSPHAAPHNYEALANDLNEFMQQQNIINPYVIGHSMGGKALMKYLINFPNKIKKAIVVDIAPKYYPPHHQAYIKAMSGLNLETLQSRQDVENAFIENGVNNIAERQFLMKNLQRDENGRFSWKINLPLLVKEIENIGEALSENDSCITPTLFVKGEKSTYYINDGDEILIHKIFKNAQIKTVLNSGHWVQAEQPQAFFETTMAFLKD